MGFGPHAIGGMLGAIALLAIVSLSVSFKPNKPKPLAPETSCDRPTYGFNNHCLENLKANIEYYNCAGELKLDLGVSVPATTQYVYTLPADSQHIHWVRLYCPATSTGLAAVANGTCSQSAATTPSCSGFVYCVTFVYGSGSFCIDGGAMNISYGPC